MTSTVPLPLSNKTAIVGVGSTPIVRETERSLGSFALEAALNAIADAGLTRDDIDGYVGSPGAPNAAALSADGFDEVSAGYALGALGIKEPRWSMDIRGLPSASVMVAAQALASGACTYALVLRAMYRPTGTRYNRSERALAAGPEQFSLPYGLGAGGGRFALWLQRYMHDTGATREELFSVVQAQREHAQRNPLAYWRGKELTRDQYLSSRWIYEPLCLYDCDLPVTAAGALVMTTAERARDLPHTPAYVSGSASTDQPASAIFEASGVARADVQVAQLYDGFSPFVWYWLERLGFCGPGEGHAYVQAGHTRLGGALPVNTFGGSLGEGRLHGFGHVREGVLQVMGRAGERQVSNVQHCLVAPGFPPPTYWALMLSNTV